MKPHFRVLLAIVTGALTVALPAGAQVVPETEPIAAGRKAEPGRYETGLDALHYEIEVALSDISADMTGHVRVRLLATGPDVDAVTLDFTGLAVDSVRVDDAAPAAVRHRDGRLEIGFGRTLAPTEEVDVDVYYRGTPDDGLIIRENVEGDPSAFVDNWPNRTRFWLPSRDHPSDKATAAFTIHAPAAWEVVANGRQVERPRPTPAGTPGPAVSGDRLTWRYLTDMPHPTYTLVVGAADMVVDRIGLAACGRAPASPRPDGCVEVTTWLYPGSVATGAPSFVRAAEMVEFFTDLVGPFPWEKLAHVQSATRFGGMENSSAIFYSEEAIARGADIEGTVSHETAHQWFGDAVTQSDWGHLWLSEGFATYFGALFFEHADGIERFRELMRGSRDRYLAAADSLRPVVDEDQQDLFALLNRNSYQKGGWVLHMLRSELGDQEFFEGIRLYYARHRNGNARTADLRVAMEESSGRNLSRFFDQWLFSPGHPVLSVSSDTDPASGGLRITVDQVQGDYAPRFELLIPIAFRRGGSMEIERVRLTDDSGDFVFPDVPPDTEWVVDPEGELLARIVPRG